jgi:hypothetical protein
MTTKPVATVWGTVCLQYAKRDDNGPVNDEKRADGHISV